MSTGEKDRGLVGCSSSIFSMTALCFPFESSSGLDVDCLCVRFRTEKAFEKNVRRARRRRAGSAAEGSSAFKLGGGICSRESELDDMYVVNRSDAW